MGKVQHKYLEVHPFKIIENGFHQDRAMVSESLFSLGNEYLGVRGFFDEDYSDKKLIGTYFNGIYDYSKSETPNAYLGIVKRTHFTLNTINFFRIKLTWEDEVLDLAIVKYRDFKRSLDLTNGLYERSFTWIHGNKELVIIIKRLINMEYCHEAYQEISFKANCSTKINLELIIDGNTRHWGREEYLVPGIEEKNGMLAVGVKTSFTKQKVVSLMKTNLTPVTSALNKKIAVNSYDIELKKNKEEIVKRYIINLIDKNNTNTFSNLIDLGQKELYKFAKKDLSVMLEENKAFFDKIYEATDIEIEGDPDTQQGIRYCIFQLAQTYHGFDKDNNIGAKGLTGEAYSGHAFWDVEAYCLPYYLFSNQEASLNLLMFRYNTLNAAKLRAKELDCEGACYPVATRDGNEACNLWQHASLQFQPSTAVFYGIMHYMNIYNDEAFLTDFGMEMIIEIAKFLLSRGDFSADKKSFGFYGVMGPDEFQMMVNHNTYTNFMAKEVFRFILDNKDKYADLYQKFGMDNIHLNKMNDAFNKMVILYDEKTHLFEQHDGYFKLPHLDIKKIPEEEFPLYSHWSYDRIYRNDMIKQPDVLMFMFLYNSRFNDLDKKANYDYYEPRCIHESSLSPSIHSIFAEELGYEDAAYNFFQYATRLDLDDYNNNTCEGIHTTSIAAAWMNIVYGFGGMRSDDKLLKLAPKLPNKWNAYSFRILYHNSHICVRVEKNRVIIKVSEPVDLIVYNKEYHINKELKIVR